MKLPALTIPKQSLTSFDEVIAQEWIVTNGIGGYSSSSVPNVNTRKYHGLLVAALNPPGDRTVCLAKLDEDLIVNGTTLRLGQNEFSDGFFPQGYEFLKEFRIDPYPTYLYEAGQVVLKKTIFLPHKQNAAAILYNATNSNSSEVKVRLYPMLNCRYYHTVTDRNRFALNFLQESHQDSFQTHFARPHATFACRASEGRFVEGLNWVDRVHFRSEAERVESDFDDCFQPGYFELSLPAQSSKSFAVTFAVSSHAQDALQLLDSIGKSAQNIDTSFLLELGRREALLDSFYRLHPEVPASDWLNWLLLAADSFMVEDAEGKKSVIAGYHWFEPWGRDTFISLPGLTLVTGRFGDAKDILRTFIRYLKGGMIPNFVADKTGVPVYNTVDGTFWYVNAVWQYLKYTGDYTFVKDELWDNLKSIIENHVHGTMFGIKVDESDGLLMHGPRLSWMDAVVEGDMITPRAGKAVEIQALWYNTLRIMEALARQYGDPSLLVYYGSMAEKTKKSFNEHYWNSKLGCLYDVLEPSGVDASIRPNQIFAVSLDYTMLDRDRNRRVVDFVSHDLLTPYGLRTLSLDDPKFVGKCIGDRRSRDNAYHNGTIWPWLLGSYITAYLKVNDYSPQARKYALDNFVLPLCTVGMLKGGLGTINEIYDCDPPNAPRGCISQAWSIAEPLRAYVEDVLGIKPKVTV
jgi:predicted glycogen debranching enzyme